MILLVSGATRTVARYPDVGVLLTPRNGNSVDGIAGSGRPWAADNDAFSGFDSERYWKMLAVVARADRSRLLWVTVPDVVCNPRETLNLWFEWWPQLEHLGLPAAFVGQDGIENIRDEIPWNEMTCWFVGGSTEWKLGRASAELAAEAKARNKWVHVGRVNSRKRLHRAADMGADSVDGGQFSMFPDTWIPRGRAWIRQKRQQRALF